MQLSNVHEDSSAPRKLYLGIENFQVTAVNPTLTELQEMGIPATTHPEYVTTVKRNYGDGEKEYQAVNIRLYLDNNDPSNPIRTQVNYQVVQTHQVSSTMKTKVINNYGSDAWLEEEFINSGTAPSNMQWFITEGMRKCYRGEENVIAFLKAYRNLPNVKATSTEEEMKKGICYLTDADWDKIFKGDFNDLRDAIIGVGAKGKCGYLMGVRHLEDKDVQTIYKNLPLKRYVKKVGGNEYLTKQVNDSQDAGAYADVTFDTSGYKLREYDPTMDRVTPDEVDVPAFASAIEEDDDLPF